MEIRVSDYNSAAGGLQHQKGTADQAFSDDMRPLRSQVSFSSGIGSLMSGSSTVYLSSDM